MRISVVIPVLDDAEELAGCLATLAAQTYGVDEIVVVDNGCSDNSRAIAEAGGARVVDEPRRGIPAASATGYDAASGDIICRLDADSRPGPEWIARIAEHFHGHPDLVAVTGPGRFIGLTSWRLRAAQLLYMDTYFWSVSSAMAHPTLFGSNMAMRATAWNAVRGRVHRFDPQVHDDIDLAFQFNATDHLRYDKHLVVGISARPFDDRAALGLRFRRAFHTIWVNWRRKSPAQRWMERAGVR